MAKNDPTIRWGAAVDFERAGQDEGHDGILTEWLVTHRQARLGKRGDERGALD
ncbi:MAG: hypothetical protein P8Y03_22175 [Anaerolineales bacterium]